MDALEIGRNKQGANVTPRSFALGHSWRACTQQFLANVAAEPEA